MKGFLSTILVKKIKQDHQLRTKEKRKYGRVKREVMVHILEKHTY